jgi:ABC-type uncharacterized transport system fused permease/ATPase subunit
MVKTVWKQIDSYLTNRNSLYMFGLGIGELLIAFFIGFAIPVLTIIFIILALIDILKSEFTGSNKLIWVIVVIVLPLLGSILYFVIGTKQKITKQESKQEAVTEKEK